MYSFNLIKKLNSTSKVLAFQTQPPVQVEVAPMAPLLTHLLEVMLVKNLCSWELIWRMWKNPIYESWLFRYFQFKHLWSWNYSSSKYLFISFVTPRFLQWKLPLGLCTGPLRTHLRTLRNKQYRHHSSDTHSTSNWNKLLFLTFSKTDCSFVTPAPLIRSPSQCTKYYPAGLPAAIPDFGTGTGSLIVCSLFCPTLTTRTPSLWVITLLSPMWM